MTSRPAGKLKRIVRGGKDANGSGLEVLLLLNPLLTSNSLRRTRAKVEAVAETRSSNRGWLP